jgi:hypothetical protein
MKNLECFSKPFTVLKKPMRVGQFLLKPISGNVRTITVVGGLNTDT